MQTKNQNSIIRKIFYVMMLLSVFFSAFGTTNLPVASAQEEILTTHANEDYFATFEEAIEASLEEYESNTDLAFALQIMTSTADDTYGYAKVQPDRKDTSTEEQEEFQLLLMAQNTANGWYAIAPEIVPNETYNNLLNSFPDTMLDEFDKGYYYQYDILEIAAQAVSGHKLPWENGRTAILVRHEGSGHENQIDFDISAQAGTWHSNAGYVYASKPGTVVYVKEISSNPSGPTCPDSNYWRTANVVVIMHSSSEYSWYYHLANDSVIVNEGDTVNYGTRIAQEGRTGCTGGTTGIHLHYMISTSIPTFPSRTDPNVAPWPPGGSITTVDFQEVAWSNLVNGTTYTSQNTAGGGGNACPAPSLSSPSDGYVSSSQTITFNWSALSGCTFNGYTFRIKDTSNMDSGGNQIVDTGEGGTSRTETIGTQWNNRDLWWGVKAANAPNGASWSVRRFRIEPGSGGCPSVSGEVRLYDSTNCGGSYAPANATGLWTFVPDFNDKGESIAIPSGWSARLYQNDNENANESACFGSTDTNLNDNTYANGGNVGNSATWMRVYDNSNCTGVSAPGAPALSSPSNGQFFNEGESINLSWSATGSEYYGEIWGGPGGTLTFGWQSGTSNNIGSQWAGYTYYWHVKARNSAGESGWSETRTFAVRPGAPSNLSATAASCSQINLSWSDNSGNEEGYKVYRNGSLIATLGSGTTSYQNTGLSGNTNYSYTVKAYRGGIESNSSNTANSTTQTCTTPPDAEFDAWPLSGTAPLTTALHIVSMSNITSCSWNYGDGQTSTTCTQLHNHIYSTAGSYTVSLTVNGPGGSDSMTRTNYITVSGGSVSDDNYEQNDTLVTAYELSTWEQTWLSTINGYGKQVDEDWYKISVTSNYNRVLIDLRFTHSQGDIDVALYNSAGGLLAYSNGVVNNEYIDYTVPASGGTYYIQVYFADAGNQYDLWWDDIQPPAAGNTNITIGGVSMGNYNLASGTSQVLQYPVDGGPVVIGNVGGPDIIASLNQWRRRPSTTVGWTGVSQSMGLPVSLITNQYFFPRYDYSNTTSLYNALLLANVDTVSRDITVTIGGVPRGTYTIAPSGSQFVTYPGLVGGPVVVSSATGAQIVASLYELIRDPSAAGWNGQSEMMGLPFSQLSDEYLIPIYYGAASPNTLNASLHIANVDSFSTVVEVVIAGVSRGTYALDPSTSIVVKYAVDGGPVEISSNNGANIVASLNQWRRRPSTTVGWTGVSQSMALPVSLITNQYVLPRYDYSNTTSLYNAILLANVDSVSRNITVAIGGVDRGTYTIAPSQSQFVTYPGVVDGPVIVSSDVGAQIVASLYELIRDPSAAGWNGQSEMMGLPFTQLSDQYLIPLYFGAANPNTLNASLYIAVP